MENLCRCKYGFLADGKAISNLIKARKFPKYEKALLWCKDIRNINILQHDHKIYDISIPKIDGGYIIEPDQRLIDLLKKMIDMVSNLPRGIEYAIHPAHIVSASLEKQVKPYIREMIKKLYTYSYTG